MPSHTLSPSTNDAPAEPLGKIFRNLAHHSAVYSVVGILSRFVSFFMLPVYTRWLTTTEYGVLELLDITSNFIGAVIGSRFGDALTNVYFSTDDDARRKRIVSTGLIGMTAIGALLALSILPFGPYLSQFVFGSPAQTRYFYFTFAALGVFLPSEAAFAYIRALNRSALYTGLQCLRLFLQVSLNIVFLIGLRLGIEGILLSGLIGAVVTQVVLTVFVLSRCGCGFDMPVFQRQLRFSLPLITVPAGMMFVHYGDRMFLKNVVSLADIGVYALAYKIGMLVSYLVNPFLFYWRAQMYALVKPGGENRAYPRIATYTVLFLATLGLLCAVFARPAIALLAGPAYQQGAVFVPLVALGYVLLNASEFFRSILLVGNRPGREARIVAAGTVVCAIAYSTFIPAWKFWGAASATTLTFGVLLVYGLWEAQRAIPVRLETGRLARIAIAALLAFGVSRLLPGGAFWTDVAGASASVLLYIALLAAGGFLSDDERRQLRPLLDRLTQRRRNAAAGVG